MLLPSVERLQTTSAGLVRHACVYIDVNIIDTSLRLAMAAPAMPWADAYFGVLDI